MMNYNMRSNNMQNIHIFGLIALLLVIISNYIATSNLSDSLFTSVLNFDQSLSMYSEKLINSQGILAIWSFIIIIAHIYLYFWIIASLRSYAGLGWLSALLFGSLIIMGLHAIHFAIISNNPINFNTISSIIPYTGLFDTIISLTNIDLSNHITTNNINQTINQSVNLDLTTGGN